MNLHITILFDRDILNKDDSRCFLTDERVFEKNENQRFTSICRRHFSKKQNPQFSSVWKIHNFFWIERILSLSLAKKRNSSLVNKTYSSPQYFSVKDIPSDDSQFSVARKWNFPDNPYMSFYTPIFYTNLRFFSAEWYLSLSSRRTLAHYIRQTKNTILHPPFLKNISAARFLFSSTDLFSPNVQTRMLFFTVINHLISNIGSRYFSLSKPSSIRTKYFLIKRKYTYFLALHGSTSFYSAQHSLVQILITPHTIFIFSVSFPKSNLLALLIFINKSIDP